MIYNVLFWDILLSDYDFQEFIRCARWPYDDNNGDDDDDDDDDDELFLRNG